MNTTDWDRKRIKRRVGHDRFKELEAKARLDANSTHYDPPFRKTKTPREADILELEKMVYERAYLIRCAFRTRTEFTLVEGEYEF